MNWKDERKKAYVDKLRDPRWQKKRLEILQRDNWTCVACGDKDSTLHIHHRWYERGAEPWDVVDEALVTLCETCHEQETANRPSDEAELLKSIKRRYFSFELCQIAKVLDHMAHQHVIEVQLTGVAWFLSQPTNIDSIMESYFSNGCPMPGRPPPQPE